MATTDTQDARLVSYNDLFFGLGPQDLPNLAILHGLRWNEDELLVGNDTQNHELLSDELRWVRRICDMCGCSPILFEFALISETRAIGPKTTPFFSSFISMFVRPADALAEVYASALRAMASTPGDRTQIVPHTKMYEFKTGVIDIDCSQLAPARPRALGDGLYAEPVGIGALRQEFQQDRDHETDLLQRVRTFVTMLLGLVNDDPRLSDAASLLSTSRFVLLPFVRPEHESSIEAASLAHRHQWRAFPGGALFLFVRPNNGWTNDSTMRLARALSWVLAESSVRESFDELHATENRRRDFLSYSITHPLKHRLGSLQSDMRWLKESYNAKDDDFPARLDVHSHLVDTIYGFGELCHAIYYSAVNGPEATLTERDAGGRLKFAATKPLNVVSRLREAAANRALGDNAFAQVHLDIDPGLTLFLDGFHDGGHNVKTRLNDNLYREIFWELMSNALRHGRKTAECDDVRVHVTVESIEGKLAIVFTNEVEKESYEDRLASYRQDWHERMSVSPTGLTFVSDVLRWTDAGRLLIKRWKNGAPGRFLFSVAVTLKGLRVGDPDSSG